MANSSDCHKHLRIQNCQSTLNPRLVPHRPPCRPRLQLRHRHLCRSGRTGSASSSLREEAAAGLELWGCCFHGSGGSGGRSGMCRVEAWYKTTGTTNRYDLGEIRCAKIRRYLPNSAHPPLPSTSQTCSALGGRHRRSGRARRNPYFCTFIGFGRDYPNYM